MEKYEIGDIVRATTGEIRRVDNRATIYPGGPVGRVTQIYTMEDGTQIITIQVGHGMPIGSLVVSDSLPLAKVSPPPQNTMGVIGNPS